MARTSRKNIVLDTASSKLYRVAGYVRLSVVKPSKQQDSIENQKRIIADFVSTNPDMEFYKFYVDENASGGSFERKAFEEMLEDVSAGEIDCVIVKDLSRLGRNAIETTFYIQHLFPQKGIRFVSVSDRFDTIDGITDISFDKSSGIRVPIANIFNEEYAADISRKTQASIDANIHSGKSVAPRAPYGYKKSVDDCHALVVDPVAAEVVREIFDMAAKKISLNEIVRRLNLASIPTPIDYAVSQGLEGNYDLGSGSWNTRSVKYILTNRTYTGDLQQGKEGHISTNTHEALVDRDIFMRIQESFTAASSSGAQAKSSVPDNPLKGKVVCGSCGGKMQRRKGSGNAGWHFFSCITNNRKGSGCSTGMYIREPDIRKKIQTAVATGNALSKMELDNTIRDQVLEIVVYKDKELEVRFG